MGRLGIEKLSTFGMPPVELVNLAADLGCANISMGLSYTFALNPHGYPQFDLRDDHALRRETIAAMRDRGVSISLAEGLLVKPDIEACERARDLDAFAELGANRANMVSFDSDLSRTFDQFAILAAMAAERGIASTIEFAPGLTIANLPTALAAIRHVARPDFSLLIDTMHFSRSGSTPADLAAIDPELIGYVQLCDAPWLPQIESYMEEAMTERRAPGQGELPLLEILQAAPRDRVVSLEVPLLSQAKAGVGPYERLRPVVEAARDLLVQLDATAT